LLIIWRAWRGARRSGGYDMVERDLVNNYAILGQGINYNLLTGEIVNIVIDCQFLQDLEKIETPEMVLASEN